METKINMHTMRLSLQELNVRKKAHENKNIKSSIMYITRVGLGPPFSSTETDKVIRY